MNPWKQGHYSHLELSEERAITNVKFSHIKQSQACYILFYNNRELHKLTSFYCRLKPSKRTKNLKFSCIFGKILVPFKVQLSGRSAILGIKGTFRINIYLMFRKFLAKQTHWKEATGPNWMIRSHNFLRTTLWHESYFFYS